MNLRRLFDSILEAVFTVSPKRQYRGIFEPTTPATHGPETYKEKIGRLFMKIPEKGFWAWVLSYSRAIRTF